MAVETSGSAAIKIGPEDPRYAPLCRGFNPRWTARPDYIRLPRTGREVRSALQEAVDENASGERSRITVRSGGHCYENFVSSDDVRVIFDLTLMDGIYHDADMDAVCIEAGATIGQHYKSLYLPTRKIVPGGSCPGVGAGGHIPGGGFGLLSRQYGLTVDYLYAVEVAVVDRHGRAKLVKATADDRDRDVRDLWWAHTGGGGGSFGIATRFWFRDLPEAPRTALFTSGGWNWSELDENGFRRIVANFGEFFAEHQGGPDDPYADLFAILLLTHPSKEKVGLIAQLDSAVPDSARLMADFLDQMNEGVRPEMAALSEAVGEYPALADLQGPLELPWPVVERILGHAPNPRAGKHKSAYMRTPLPESQVDALWNGLIGDRHNVRDAVVQIDSYGSKVNSIGTDTAVAQRDSILKLQHQVYWPETEPGDDHLRWIRELYRNMYPGGVPVPGDVTDGCFINYPDVDLSDPAWNTSGVPWSTLYFGDKYPRLQQIKRRWDPLNVFRHRQSVELPDAE
ncbi:BBE domain-containing protein [Actinomadura fulvescens]|uniref:FAD-binding oxidoreductase n=1 Tax=Actinomadura fulvescens TaxID=46160 RepID=A0ABN3PIE1_9ACTN